MEVGAQVEITLPTDGTWDAPNGVGKVTLDDDRSVSLGTTGTSMTATTVVPLDTGDTIVFRYKNVASSRRRSLHVHREVKIII